ncbi:MAG: SusC/RagA family TonB-linked outer membrane protein, partial [Muribaculaceae bacterium]|nr:SusC/RagA family TonB-linked outer membrane protein [Muribaculaceae bacterium]
MCRKAGLEYRIFGRQVTLFPKGKTPKNLDAAKVVTGKVVDETGEPLVGAAIVLKGKGEGTMTDFDGNFQLPAAKGQELEISYVGYAPQTVKVGEEPMQITMAESTNNLEEVVVVGYGSVKKKDLTGGLTVVDEKTLKMSASANLMDRLVGQVAGFSITSSEAKPGADQSLLIRGTNSLSGGNSPLVILDGIPYEGSLSDIDPNLVESITVLKDASSVAIYGSRGSNGVILIQTQKGAKGAAKVVYKGNYAVASEMQRIETMGPNEYIRFKQDMGRLGTKKLTGVDLDPLYGQVISASERINYAAGITRDWQDDVFRTSFQHEHQLSISGGTDATTYMAAVSYLNQPGVVYNSNYERINVYASITQVLNKWLTVGLIGQFVNRETGGMTPNLEHAIKQSPYGIFMADNGNYYDEPMDYSNLPNPMRNVRADSKNTSRNALGNGFIEIAPIKGLTIKSQIGYNYRDNFTGSYYGRDTATGLKVDGSASISTSRTTDWTWENIVKHTNTFGKHYIDLTGL